MPDRGTCKSCGAVIFWGKTIHGRMMPVDAAPSADGNIAIKEDGGIDVLGAETLNALNKDPLTKPDLYCSHFKTCPNAEWMRRKRR
jgi:hypothetical protein